MTRKRLFVVIAAALVLIAGGMALVFAYSTWSDVNRVTIERPPPEGGGALAQEGEDEAGEDSPSPSSTDGVELALFVGSDSRDQLDELDGFGDFGGQRADVVMVLIRTRGATAVLSLPRDLLVDDPCSGRSSRLNALLEGCGDRLNGPSLLLNAVERLIGERIDHYAMVDLAGFPEVVDAIGGYEICLERPVRDRRAGLELPEGCTLASGAQTLAWLRSRHTQELTAGGWQVMPGMNDLVRNQRQRGFIIEVLSGLSRFSSPQALTTTARAVAPHLTVDDQLTLSEAVNLAWALRGLKQGDFTELEVPVIDHITENGAAVLVPRTPIDEIVGVFLETHATAELPDARAG